MDWDSKAFPDKEESNKLGDIVDKASNIVKIEDLLPYFNQNIKIENFKD